MPQDRSLPSYEDLFSDPAPAAEDEARSVHSPAAYLADLLQLLGDGCGGAPAVIEARRPDILTVPLDAATTTTEVPYLDIVNEVLEKDLAGSSPFSVPHERVRLLLGRLGVGVPDLYRLFAPGVDGNTMAREFLGLTPEEFDSLLADVQEQHQIRARLHLGDEGFEVLADPDRLCAAAGITRAEIAEFWVAADTPATSPDPYRLDWAVRVVRLARRAAMTLSDLSLVLRDCCGGEIYDAPIRTVALVKHLRDELDLPVDVVVSLIAPISTVAPPGDDLFNRVFNVPFVATEGTVVRGTAELPEAYRGLPELFCAGDLLAPRNTAYRRRLSLALSLSDADLTTIVSWYRRTDEPGPFDREIGLAALSLLHRIGRLTAALGIGAGELLDLLDALDADPSVRRHPAFPVLIDTGAPQDSTGTVLAAGSPSAALWLIQVVRGAVLWMGETGLTGRELLGVLGRDPGDPAALIGRLREDFGPAAFAPALLISERFDARAARVLHGVLSAESGAMVSERDARVLRVDPGAADAAAYRAVSALTAITAADFTGLGLGDRGAAKIFAGLVAAGYLEASGELLPGRVPAAPDELALTVDFAEYRDRVFALIAAACAASPDGAVMFHPSDLTVFDDLTGPDQAELYDNLVFHRYVAADGEVSDPGFFADPANVAAFTVDADLGDIEAEVLNLLHGRAARFGLERIALDPAIFAGLKPGRPRIDALIHSLRFNGHLDAGGCYADPAGLIDIGLTDFGLALEFHPYRRAVLAAVQEQLRRARSQVFRMTEDDFREVADAEAARRIVAQLDGVPDPAATTIDGLTAEEATTVRGWIEAIVATHQPYRLDPAALAGLGFDGGQTDKLIAHLVSAGYLTATLAVAEDRLEYFGTAQHALDFVIPGLEDFSREIFYLLYAVAVELTDAVEELTATLAAREKAQWKMLVAATQDALGVPAAAAEAIVAEVTGGAAEALDLLVVPALAGEPALDPAARRAFRQIAGFAVLAGKLGLTADEVTLAFRDQSLVGKFPEPLVLPAGVDRIDALLESQDGKVHLFRRQSCWTYSASTFALLEPGPVPLTDLSPHFAPLAGVDAAFTDAAGAEWIVGRTSARESMAFSRGPGEARWAPRQQSWGTVHNNFTDPERIDAAFVDGDGRVHLFHGDQFVVTSGPDRKAADDGYPRRIGESWESEQHRTALPQRFRSGLDAAFRGRDGRTHLFAGDRFLTVGGAGGDQPIAGAWGNVRNNLASAGRPDAAYTCGPGLHLTAGDQIVRYADSLENDGVRVADGFPQRIGTHLPAVPAEFEGGAEAVFVDPAGTLHLFREGRTVGIGREGAGEIVPTAQRWGRLGEVLAGGAVDAAMVGPDGRTYLFSGPRYVRYSGADYAAVDTGHPRSIAADWAGLRQVGASFVLDGVTHLFGAAGKLFDAPLDLADDLDAGRVPRSLRQRLAEHGLGVADEAEVSGTAPQWRLTAERGIGLELTRTATSIEVHVGQETTEVFHVRYTTRDYTKPDAGHPRPLAADFWNLPDDLAGGDGEFARVDAVLTARDGRTYLFSGGRYVVFDNKRRWWSAPKSLRTDWDSLPFERVDAAFVGADERTYVFARDRYVRYSDPGLHRVDDRYPVRTVSFWGTVVNTIERTGQVDATLVIDPDLLADHDGPGPAYTYLFSGDQYVRYTGTELETVDDGYPRSLTALAQEPVLRNLTAAPDRVDAAFADRRTVFLLSGPELLAVSVAATRRYAQLPGVDLAGVRCAYTEDGAVLAERADGWYHLTALEGTAVAATPVRPRALRTVPEAFRTGLDAVLRGTDGNTYLFKGAVCYDTGLRREYPLAQEWGRPRNGIYHDNRVDAAFAGTDGRTYVFSGDQFVTYEGTSYLDEPLATGPLPVAEHWAGLEAVALAFVRDGVTHLFEPVGPDGEAGRYAVYSGAGYDKPDSGFPRAVEADFWDIPERYRLAGFTQPDAVLFENGSMLVLTGEVCLRRDETTGEWSYPRPLGRIWPGIGEAFATAFIGRDGATYLFFDGEFARYADGKLSAREQIRDRWGRTRNNFLADGGTVDAAAVAGGATYLFSGDQYVRYSGPDYRYADTGYPRPIATGLRTEAPFAALPASFGDELADRALDRRGPLVDAVVANDRTCHIIAGGVLHVASRKLTASLDAKRLGAIRNTVADRGRVDAALVTDRHTFVFSGDQYVRYSGRDHERADDGYPRTIAAGLPAELGLAELPAEFTDGLDAAFRDADGRIHLFAARRFLTIDGTSAIAAPIAGNWGAVRGGFGPSTPIDAAFVAPTGHVYAFADDRYVRYLPGAFDTVEQGYPRRIRDDWGDLAPSFERGIDGAFRLAGRTYLSRGDEYVRESGGGWRGSQPFRHGFTGAGDYRLSDLRAIAGFAALAHAHPGGLATFLLPGAETVEDPYRHLADLFGWDAEELKWCRRHSRLLTRTPADEDRFELEFLLAMADVFTLTGKLGAGPSTVYAEIWTRLYGGEKSENRDAAATVLAGLLARRHGPAEWPALSAQIHDELNVLRRDALLPQVIARDAGRDGGFRTARDLYERFLIDPEMGGQARTSRVREAIAATQLYVHRYLLNLDDADRSGLAAALTRTQVRGWWSWMRSYRVWEANRKVFLHPENYLRPELRANKSPAFRALENDLLSAEITAVTVEQAYKRYLDEYTEVSRLTIAGGYVYTQNRAVDGRRRLVLFGRTKTDPRRYYYRRAQFGEKDSLAATWEPWERVDLQIDADRVHPVHAFGRVFVFWAGAETVRAAGDAGSATVAVTESEDGQEVSSEAATQRFTISYSFQNLNKEWVPAQILGSGPIERGALSGFALAVRPKIRANGRPSIEVSGSYQVLPPPTPGRKVDPVSHTEDVRFELNPEMYAVDLLPEDDSTDRESDAQEAAEAAAVRVAEIFVEPADPAAVIGFDHPDGADDLSWFSVDHQGGSFLYRLTEDNGDAGVRRPLAKNDQGLPDWDAVHAAVELPDGTRYFFHDTYGYATAHPLDATALPAGAGTPRWDSPGESEPVRSRWGRCRTVLTEPGEIDAVLSRGVHTFVLTGEKYVRFTGEPFLVADVGYPKPLAGNNDSLPPWKVDAAFTDIDGVEYFFRRADGVCVTSAALDAEQPAQDLWDRLGNSLGDLDMALLTGDFLFLIAGDRYLRYQRRARRRSAQRRPDNGYPKSLRNNPDGLPTDFHFERGYSYDAVVQRAGVVYWFDNYYNRYAAFLDGEPFGDPTGYLIRGPQVGLADGGPVGAAWFAHGALFLTYAVTDGTEVLRYTLNEDGTVPATADSLYPMMIFRRIDTVLTRDDTAFLFSDGEYARLAGGPDPHFGLDWRPTRAADWVGAARKDGPLPFDAALDSASGLYMFDNASYVRQPKDVAARRPYPSSAPPYDLVRLTTGTASELNRKLLSGGVPALLELATQETDEVVVTTDLEAVAAVHVWPGTVAVERLPTGSHLDFRSANGLYYQEIFFHAPFLIAQALNSAQRFAEARQWHEYIFDPANPDSYWRFLPFLAVDLRALARTVARDLDELGLLKVDTKGIATALKGALRELPELASAADQNRAAAPGPEQKALDTISDAREPLLKALRALLDGTLDDAQRAAAVALGERVAIIAGLKGQFGLRADQASLLAAYRDNPFDPHAIADLRPIAHRRAIVLSYLDNLLDWGDQLFQQYTPESVDEARMLYLLAYDLLGETAVRLGTAPTSPAQNFEELDKEEGRLNLIGYLLGGGALPTDLDKAHRSVADGYFHIPANTVFQEYRARVADRLRKIRASLDILGVSRPLPLFAPPIDPMALVAAAASGNGADPAVAGATVQPPPNRFVAVHRRAQELVDRLRQFGGDLLTALDRRDAEALDLLRGRQEGAILALTREIKQAQVQIAGERLAELTAGESAARQRADHYRTLIDKGMSVLERTQLDAMKSATDAHTASAVLKVAAGISFLMPEINVGPFIIGSEYGGHNLGESMDKGAEVAESLGEMHSMFGEAVGMQAQHERTAEDWGLQLRTAQSDQVQIGHQLAAANKELTIARREAELLDRQIAHGEEVDGFLRDKFATTELHGWMAGQLSGLYFQAYQLAHEMARSAEAAYRFERGVPDAAARYIGPAYWEGRRSGLLAGESLASDLERLSKAYFDSDNRELEITKQASLRSLDPVALLRFRETGSCDVALSEAGYDQDFPGQYRRQLRTLTVSFLDADGQPVRINAMLTQTGHKTVLEADPKAVKYLLDPTGPAPATIRADWRPSQQIALSEVDGENNGMFELRYDDDRYLPFERTGAVSTWRLERSGRAAPTLYDIVLTIRYSAQHGGPVFAGAVRGMLKPYTATRLFDVARDFPAEWESFRSGETSELALPLVPDMFPDMASRQITAVQAVYAGGNGSFALVLGGRQSLRLTAGGPHPTPGLAVSADPATPVNFTAAGDLGPVAGIALILAYRARVL